MSTSPQIKPNVDFKFVIEALPEPEIGATHLVEIFGWDLAPADETWPVTTLVLGDLLETHITDNPYGMVEAAREAQAYSLEERFKMEAEREMEERSRYS